MKILITGICGFVGSRLASALAERLPGLEICGIDNLLRSGSEHNRDALAGKGVRFVHGDLRMRSDLEALPDCDWVIDAAANPSVLAGLKGSCSPRQLYEHNLAGTLNVVEYCRDRAAGLLLLSSSRVYSARDLAQLPMATAGDRFALDLSKNLPAGVSGKGLTERFPQRQPFSLYGAAKLASEVMALEHGYTFEFPVWINRCGVLAGAGQFGTAEQGIFSYWLHAHAARLPLHYIGFNGMGHQVRDAFHPDDLADLLITEMRHDPPAEPIFNVGGGAQNAMSLAELTQWCNQRFGSHAPLSEMRERPFDVPWIVMDSSKAAHQFGWTPKRQLPEILAEIAEHVRANPDWLRCVGPVEAC